METTIQSIGVILECKGAEGQTGSYGLVLLALKYYTIVVSGVRV